MQFNIKHTTHNYVVYLQANAMHLTYNFLINYFTTGTINTSKTPLGLLRFDEISVVIFIYGDPGDDGQLHIWRNT